eukprot:TRINITY_DN5533_c0_g1_i1.p1 TRINITY_DN5533_c0_g1~~TRINITY_DN5533_c0_g1_i1.p1  ORF type:complete len:417 (+),score=111.99 TRINITY_DN5533_c0_g1_i1:156-1406(+)
MILSDRALEDIGYVEKLRRMILRSSKDHHRPVAIETFVDIEPDPSFTTILRGLEQLRNFKPRTILALGGGSVMDAAKVIRLLLDHPEINDMDGLKLRFLDITKRIFTFPSSQDHSLSPDKGSAQKKQHHEKWARNTDLVCIPTTSGTGSEVSPFAVVTDPRDSIKYPICSYSMTPQMAIVDSAFTETLPASQIAAPGYDAIVHAIESYTSVMASSFTRPSSARALQLLIANHHLEKSFSGAKESRAAVHHAATLAGCAIANAFVGIAHSIAHQIGAKFHIAHGIACAITLPHVIRFNSTEAPLKQATFPQYSTPDARRRYVEIAVILGLHVDVQPNDPQYSQQMIDKLLQTLVSLREKLGLPACLAECGVDRNAFISSLEELAVRSFDDQCTGTNPRYPLISELKQILLDCYENPN